MHNFIVGDIVKYKLDKENNLYVIEKINNDKCIINGVNYRIILDVDVKDIEKASNEALENVEKKEKIYRNKIVNVFERNKDNYLLGKILHIDGDEKYLKKCLELYDELGIYAYGVRFDEKDIHTNILQYLYEINPEIIVITGHDFYNGEGLKDLNSYKNTKHFIKAIKEVRKFNQNCCIIAGACQSNFEALIASGADFASSPDRINIHVYDPAVIAIKAATTSFRQLIDFDSVCKYIEKGKSAFNGVQTFGKMKLIL